MAIYGQFLLHLFKGFLRLDHFTEGFQPVSSCFVCGRVLADLILYIYSYISVSTFSQDLTIILIFSGSFKEASTSMQQEATKITWHLHPQEVRGWVAFGPLVSYGFFFYHLGGWVQVVIDCGHEKVKQKRFTG